MYWDPEWVELAAKMREAPILPAEINEEKKQAVNAIMQMAASHLPPPPDNVSAYDDQVPSGPKVRVYKPSGASKDHPLPLIYYVHGGGWFAGNLDTEDRTCRMICSLTNVVVLSVGYRCGTDVALEDEVHDCVVGLDWACDQTKPLGADSSKVVVIGGSAGGALAIAAVHSVVGRKPEHMAGLVLLNSLSMHPGAVPEKYKHLSKSYVEKAGPLPFVSGDDTLGLYKHWKITPSNINPKVFPAVQGPVALKEFPPTFIITSDNDASRDDGTVLAAMLQDAGVRAKQENFVGLGHYFWTFLLEKANARFWRTLVGGIQWTLAGKK